MSYAGNSGTLTLPSPTHCNTADFSSAARSVERIRRSLSRSPSKFQLRKSPGGGFGSPSSSLSPSPLTPGGSPSKQLGSPFMGPTTHQKSPLATPFAPSVKLSLRSTKHKTSNTYPKRTSPRSPVKRVLSESLDRANTQPQPMRMTSFGGENLSADMVHSPRRKSFEKQPQKSIFSIEIPRPPVNQALAKLETDSAAYSPSPLKRTDSTMSLDPANFGSPVPKRRSMHGSANFGPDFNVFDHAPTSTPQFDIHEDTSESTAQVPSPIFSSTPMKFQNLNMPKRSTSLRKSTLQQRQEKSTSWNRKQAEKARAAAGLSSQNGFSTPQKTKDRPRLSLDQFQPPVVERNSPFTAGALPNPSMHMFNQPQQPVFKAHPLSRSLTQSSSSGSITDESPTHVPVHAPARIPVKFDDDSRPRLDFSKSLPAGALRPTAIDNLKRQEFGNEFQTPKNDFHSAKPHAAAFMSTGLISKVNHNPEEPQSFARHHLRKSIMPDTPCKKPMSGFNTMPAPGTNAMNKVKELTRHSFGTPSIPFGSALKPSIVSRNVFGSDFSNKGRRGSFMSIAADDHTSPENLDNLMSDNDMPPTPTKSIFNELPGDDSPSSMRGNPFSMYSLNKPARTSSKLSIQIAPCESSESSHDEEDFGDVVSPTAGTFRLAKSSTRSSMSSFGRSRARKGSNAPAPLSFKPPKHSLSPPQQGSAKIRTLLADSQDRIDFEVQSSPRTPHVGLSDLLEDASRLTVSGQGRRPLTRQNTMADFAAKAPPATPTTGRDGALPNGGVTPVHVPKTSDIDEHLAARFDKVEAIGGGEFSDVYRVTQASSYFAHQSYHHGGSHGGPAGSFGTPSQAPSMTPPTPRVSVFAVKKARKPYTGPSDRMKRFREVDVLRALGKSDHTIHLEDSWEIDGYLYIQTEFCEEGSLDNFLANAGRKGRLDDFRIWKIMVELGEGIKHIHRSGFIHLDLKPANVFITFEGVLKIGDFGMATTYPAPPDIEGEGDREYIGPEILEGKYDRPADIFAFGLIMLEIAANVQLPDNGPSWQRLRSGDMTDVPSLTWSEGSSVLRDGRGEPICEESDTSMDSLMSDDEMEVEELPAGSGRKRNFNPTKTRSTSHDPLNLFGSVRRGELNEAPPFMKDMYHESSIDQLVKKMLFPEPSFRPTIEDLMKDEGVRWVKERRRAGATVFEGNFGPADEMLVGGRGSFGSGEDAEMIDV